MFVVLSRFRCCSGRFSLVSSSVVSGLMMFS